ncbi:MAG: hypothetical protein ACOX6H_03695 [Christensenellales bacterium]|jgi:hypothetical protein
MVDIKDLKNTYFHVTENPDKTHKIEVLRLIEDNGASKSFIALQLASDEESGKLTTYAYAKELKNEDIPTNLFSCFHLLNSLKSNEKAAYDTVSKLGFKMSDGAFLVTYGEDNGIKKHDTEIFNRFILEAFLYSYRIFDDQALFKFFAETYKKNVSTYNEVARMKDRKEILKRNKEHEKIILYKADQYPAAIKEYYNRIIEEPVFVSRAINYCQNHFAITINANPKDKEQLMSLPIETKRLIILGYIKDYSQTLTDENVKKLEETCDVLYTIVLKLMKNIKLLPENAMSFGDAYPPLKNVYRHNDVDEQHLC